MAEYINLKDPEVRYSHNAGLHEVYIIGSEAERIDLVRCGECKHRDPEDHKCDCGHDIIWQLPRDDNWFCADGKRREDDDI